MIVESVYDRHSKEFLYDVRNRMTSMINESEDGFDGMNTGRGTIIEQFDDKNDPGREEGETD